MDWTYATNDVDVLVTRGRCSFEQLEADQCTVLGFAISETAKPERVRITGAAAGTYTLFVENLGPEDESVSYQVVLSPGAVAAAAEPVPLRFDWKTAPRYSRRLR